MKNYLNMVVFRAYLSLMERVSGMLSLIILLRPKMQLLVLKENNLKELIFDLMFIEVEKLRNLKLKFQLAKKQKKISQFSKGQVNKELLLQRVLTI